LVSSNREFDSASTAQPQLPPSSPLAPYPPTGRQIAVSLGALAAGFVLAAVLVHQCIRDPLHLYAEIRSEKLALLDLWRGRATSAAFGSSHVDNGFDPRVFDREMGTEWGSMTTLNLGVSGGSQTEQETVVDAFVQSLPAPEPNSPPRLALLEISASANFTLDHLFHPRAINIYDFRTVERALHFADRRRIGWRRAVGRASFAVVAGVLHYCNVGMLSSQIFSPPLNRDLFDLQTADDRRGLTPNSLAARDSREWLADEKLLNARHAERHVPGEIVEGHFVVLRELAEAARRKHVQFVYFVAPRLDDLETIPMYPESIPGPLGPIWILNEGDPDLHPELFCAEMWHDPLHLTTAGAALFTKILADDLRSKLHLANREVTAGRDIALR
jgi:hypothetical protein